MPSYIPTPREQELSERLEQLQAAHENLQDLFTALGQDCDIAHEQLAKFMGSYNTEHARAEAAIAVLRDMEWSHLNDGRGVTQVQCPACFALRSRGTGHNPFCGLAAVIAKADGE